jgi:hypothetical protein
VVTDLVIDLIRHAGWKIQVTVSYTFVLNAYLFSCEEREIRKKLLI